MRRTLTVVQQGPNNETVRTNVSYVSNTASNADLYQFAVDINALTENTFVRAELTTVETIDDN